MALTDLLAVVDTGDSDSNFISNALRFAELHDAQLTFLIISVIPSGDYAGVYGPPYIILSDFTEAVATKQERLGELTRRAKVEVRTISELPETIFATASVQARYADLVLFGPDASFGYPPVRREVLETILFASGRPVLVLPDNYTPRAIAHFAVGWNATREATLALRDAMKIATPGAKADVLVLEGRPSSKGHGSEPGADIGHHLARHGFLSTVYPLGRGEAPDGEAVGQAARRHGAQLLALGAYGHSRFREMLLGGVTRELLGGGPIPILFSH